MRLYIASSFSNTCKCDYIITYNISKNISYSIIFIDNSSRIKYNIIMIKIMFVCHGNICRSPMAEFVLKDMVKRRGL